MTSLFDRIKGDFFSIMAPGFYFFTFCILIVIAIAGKNQDYLSWNGFLERSKNWENYLLLGFLAVFVAYLFGNIIRSIPVGFTEKICKPFMRWVKKNNSGLMQHYYVETYPYPGALGRLLQARQKNGFSKSKYTLPSEKTMHTEFIYYKSVLCSDVPTAFSYTQSLEARVRLFSGIFWGGFFGLLVCLAFFCLNLIFENENWWMSFHYGVFIFSLLSVMLFGGRLPIVRGQEVEYIFYCYLKYLDD